MIEPRTSRWCTAVGACPKVQEASGTDCCIPEESGGPEAAGKQAGAGAAKRAIKPHPAVLLGVVGATYMPLALYTRLDTHDPAE